MIFPIVKFAEWLNPPVTRQRVYQWIERGDLVKTGKKIDTDHPTNAAWIAGYPHHHQPKPVGTVKTAVPGVIVSKPADTGDEAEDVLVENILERLATVDIRQIKKVEVDKFKSIEAALKTRVERQHKRRDLIERSLVQAVFGRLYQIDANELRVLGAALAPEVAGALGVDDPEKVLAVEQMIDDKVLRVLSHIKRVMNDALVSWGAGVV